MTKVNAKAKVTQTVVNVKTDAKVRTEKTVTKFAPGQIIITKSGRRYIVDQNLRYIPMTSKKNPRRNESTSKSAQKRGSELQTNIRHHSGAKPKPTPRSVAAPRAGSLILINGQTFVVGEDRKTFIPITQTAANGQGVLTTLLEIAAVVLIADLVVDLIVDDVMLDGLDTAQMGSVGSFGSVNSFRAGDGGGVGNSSGVFGNAWDMGGFF